MNINSEFQEYIDACFHYKRDLEDAVSDLSFLEKKGNEIRYAVDFSEIHAYIFPQKASSEFYLFSDDVESTVSVIEYLSLQRLFEESKQKLILLRPYAIEFNSFLLRLREKAFSEEMLKIVNVFSEAHQLLNQPEFNYFVKLIQKDRDQEGRLEKEDYGKIIDFLQSHAPNIILLLEPERPKYIEQVMSILENGKLENFTDFLPNLNTATETETPTFKKWYKRLRRERDRGTEFSSLLDAEAVSLIERANHALQNKKTKLLLVTRSSHMIQIDNQDPFKDLWSLNGDRLLRHPRIFYILHSLNGRSREDLKQELQERLDTVNLFLKTAQNTKLGYINNDRPRDVETLLENVRSSWKSSEALDAFLGETLSSKKISRNIDGTTLHKLLVSITNSHTLNELIIKRLKDLSTSLDREHQVLGLYIQGLDPLDQEILRTSIKSWNYPNKKYIFRTKIQAIPYTFQFYSEPAGRLLEVLGSLENYSWEDAFRAFIQSFEEDPEFDYERLLAMAFIFGTLGKWNFAEDYCRRAIDLAKANTPVHESYFFLAICMRKTKHSLERYTHAIELIDEAINTKRLWMKDKNYEDPRYLKEKGTQILKIRLEFDSKAPKRYRTDDGLFLLEKALKHCDDDILLRIQIINNRLYYYIASNQYTQEKYNSDAKTDYELLLKLQQEVEPIENAWPPFILDTLAWAEFKLLQPLSNDAIQRIQDRFSMAISNEDLKWDNFSKREYESHSREFSNTLSG